MRFAASCALAVLLSVAMPAGAAEGTRYVVRLSAASVAERLELADHLARQYGGRIIGRDSVAGDATIEMTVAQADALARDRRVASVTAIANTSSITLGPYVYDGSGNIIKIGNDTYRYDSLSRLISGTASSGTRTQMYEYDGYGNLQKMVTAGGGASVTRELPINPATNRIATPTATSNVIATYDAAGNETSINNGPSRSYDALRMMTANGQGAVYIYTADDERIAVTNQTRTSWQWTLRGTDHKPLRELKETVSGPTHQWTWARDYVYADGTLAVRGHHPQCVIRAGRTAVNAGLVAGGIVRGGDVRSRGRRGDPVRAWVDWQFARDRRAATRGHHLLEVAVAVVRVRLSAGAARRGPIDETA